MSAPLLWIVIPVLLSIGFYPARRYKGILTAVAVAMALLLCGMTIVLPPGRQTNIGPLSIQLNEVMFFFGRSFVLNANSMPVIALIYGSLAFWLGASYEARVHWAFLPLSIEIAALLTAVLAVKPYLFAALLIEMVTLLCIPVITYPGHPVKRGVLRLLIFQTVGMPFILYTGWMLTGIEMGFPQSDLILRSAVFMAIGFVLLLGIFPFHTWMPMVMEEGHPYASTFILYMLSLVVFLFGVELVYTYSWLEQSEVVHTVIAICGVLMVLMGGVGAAFQNHLGRILGYTVMSEIGYSLLAFGFSYAIGMRIVFALILPRVLSWGVWALGLSGYRQSKDSLEFHKIYGISTSRPFCSIGVVIAQLSALGFKLLDGFPPRLTLWELLAQQNFLLLGCVVFGTLGLLVSAVRTIIVIYAAENEEPAVAGQSEKENLGIRLAIGIGILGILILGIIPQIFLPLLEGFQGLFIQPVP